jgi:membrane-associated phospholipid phosphatase
MGLGLSLASALFITEGLKDAAGRPRPHLLAVCDPDTSPESIARWKVGGLGGNSVDTAVPIVVTWQICRTAGTSALHNAFASWPSGHSSSSWAGCLYLTLFICAKFGVQIPFLPINSADRQYISTFDEDKKSAPPRNHAAAPPVYLLLIAAVPVGAAAYVSVSRWFDYRHHPFDIISGSVIGIACAWSSFRLYHLPIRQGSGWAWGARSRERAFWMGVGRHDYVGEEGWEAAAVSAEADKMWRMLQEMGLR